MTSVDYTETARAVASETKTSARLLAVTSSQQRNKILTTLSQKLAQPENIKTVISANQQDIENGRASGLSEALLDRLKLTEKSLFSMSEAVKEIVSLPDPVGEIENLTLRPSGIRVGRMSVPLGVILMIYESRPNVTIDAAALCLKSGNGVILRGGKEALQSNTALAGLIQESLQEVGLPSSCVTFVNETKHEFLYALLEQSAFIDLAIPRGGPRLIEAVTQRARMPVIQHYKGVCHVYVHSDAEPEMARNICVNAKVQRPGVCNATEGIVVDRKIAGKFIPVLLSEYEQYGVKVYACEEGYEIARASGYPFLEKASEADFDTEFLDLACTLKVVAHFDEALSFIQKHGSSHSEAIVTESHTHAMRFLSSVDASCVLVNASTRFNDGSELGLGAELGISTSRLHAYGPMGLKELCTKKFVVLGSGQVRGQLPPATHKKTK